MYDILIRGAELIDGSGAARRRADVGINGHQVTAIGKLDDAAKQFIDADGLVLCPGFVDVHTHFDAQVLWDPMLTPMPQQGYTTVIAGNCGFTVAPMDPGNAEFMMRLLARVEGMPVEALESTRPWPWATTADYLAHIDGSLGINVGFMVGHSAMRRAVMGEDASTRAATAQEVAR